jgi:nucleoside-diphosphate-sugar epimerase
VARCLIIGCGCRGRLLTRELIAHGHAVRGTTRDPAKRAAIEAAGAESVIADPDRVVTLAPAFEHIGVAYVLLASARGDPALHGTRLDMLLHRMVDTTVRGIVYEARGSVDPALLEAGAARVSAFCEDARIPYALLGSDPSDHAAWVAEAAGAAGRVLARDG